MKKTLSLFTMLALAFTSFSQSEVTMTISYNGKPVCNYEITMKSGDAALGRATTDNNGQVVFHDVILITPHVDVYAHKNSHGVDKTFDVKGWVSIREDLTYDLKMEEVLKAMTTESGMPESMFADSWGLNELDCH
jgi:hypothetical protein